MGKILAVAILVVVFAIPARAEKLCWAGNQVVMCHPQRHEEWRERREWHSPVQLHERERGEHWRDHDEHWQNWRR